MRLFLTFALAGTLLAGAAAPPTVSELGRSAERLVATSDIPGVVVLDERHGRRTVVAAGYSDVVRRVKARPDDRFWVGSVTKSFVATVVMQLVAEDRMQLDDTVEERLPGRLREGRRVRLRHLLNHTSGISDDMGLEPWRSAVARNPRVVIPPATLVSSAADLALEFAPGAVASYSNTNYLLLAEIVERVTGRPLGANCANESSGRCGLRSTSTSAGRRVVGSRRIHGYDVSGLQACATFRGTGWAGRGPTAPSCPARATSRCLGALLRGKLIPPPLLARMQTIVPGWHGQGMGLYRLPSPCKRWFWGHTGGTQGYVTFAAGSRDGRRFVVLAVNGVGPDAIDAMGRYLDSRLLCRR